MSDVLQWYRETRPTEVAGVSDRELSLFLGETQPALLQEDKEFAAEYGHFQAEDTRQKLWARERDVHEKNLRELHREFGAEESFAARKAHLEGSYQARLKQLGVTRLNPEERPLGAIGQAASRGGKVLKAAYHDVGEIALGFETDEGVLRNLRSYAEDPGGQMPTEVMVHGMDSSIARSAAVGGGALVHMWPTIATAVTLGRFGMGHKTANLTAMGWDESGDFSPVGALAAVGLPVVDKMGRALVSKAIVKRLQATKLVVSQAAKGEKPVLDAILNRAPALERDWVRRTLEVGGGQLANNMFLLATQTPGILESDDPNALADAIVSNLAMSLMGLKEIAKGESASLQLLRKRFNEEGVNVFDVETVLRPGKLPDDQPNAKPPVKAEGPVIDVEVEPVPSRPGKPPPAEDRAPVPVEAEPAPVVPIKPPVSARITPANVSQVLATRRDGADPDDPLVTALTRIQGGYRYLENAPPDSPATPGMVQMIEEQLAVVDRAMEAEALAPEKPAAAPESAAPEAVPNVPIVPIEPAVTPVTDVTVAPKPAVAADVALREGLLESWRRRPEVMTEAEIDRALERETEQRDAFYKWADENKRAMVRFEEKKTNKTAAEVELVDFSDGQVGMRLRFSRGGEGAAGQGAPWEFFPNEQEARQEAVQQAEDFGKVVKSDPPSDVKHKRAWLKRFREALKPADRPAHEMTLEEFQAAKPKIIKRYGNSTGRRFAAVRMPDGTRVDVPTRGPSKKSDRVTTDPEGIGEETRVGPIRAMAHQQAVARAAKEGKGVPAPPASGTEFREVDRARLLELGTESETRKLSDPELKEIYGLEASLGRQVVVAVREAQFAAAKARGNKPITIPAREKAHFAAIAKAVRAALQGGRRVKSGGAVQRAIVEGVEDVVALTLWAEGTGPRPRWIQPNAVGEAQQVRMLASAIAGELVDTGRIDFRGKVVNGTQDIALVAQAARNPRWEGMWAVAVRRGLIVGQLGNTSRLPGSTGFPLALQGQFKRMMAELDADGWYLVHNHPSGDARASDADKSSTRMLAASAPGFVGHVVINHGHYSVVDRHGGARMHRLADGKEISELKRSREQAKAEAGPDPLIGNEGNLGSRIEAAKDVARVARDFGEIGPNGVTLVFVDAYQRVRGVGRVTLEDIAGENFGHVLREQARSQGAEAVHAYYPGNRRSAGRVLEVAVSKGLLNRVATEDKALSDLLAFTPTKGLWEGQLGTQEVYRFAEDGGEPESPAYVIEDGDAKIPVKLGGMEYVKHLEMPEILRIAKQMMEHGGGRIEVRRLPKSHGLFWRSADGQIGIRITPEIFRDVVYAAQVFAHEVGHLHDFLPLNTLAHGNILGRLAGVLKVSQGMYPKDPSISPSRILTSKERGRIRRAAEAEVGTKPTSTDEQVHWRAAVRKKYAEMIEAEAKRRGLVLAKTVHASLRDLSFWWRPLPDAPSANYMKYRNSGKEIFADMLSVMLNAPDQVAARSPEAFDMFWKFLDNKPEFKKHFLAVQRLMWEGPESKGAQRLADLQADGMEGSLIIEQASLQRQRNRISWRGRFNNWRQVLQDQYWPIKRLAFKAEKAGLVIPMEHDPRRILEELPMVENDAAAFWEDMFDGTLKPLEDAGVPWQDFGIWLNMRRIALGDRQPHANNRGHDPNTAVAMINQLQDGWSTAQRKAVASAAKNFYDMFFALTTKAQKADIISKQVFDDIVVPNRGFYATYASLEHLRDTLPAGIQQQIGTLDGIANVFEASMVKAMAMINLIKIQEAKQSVVRMLGMNFPEGEIKWKKGRFLAPGRFAPPRPDDGKGIITVLVDGKRAYAEVAEEIAISFEQERSGLSRMVHQTVGAMHWLFRHGIYQSYITLNLAFHPRNGAKDFMRSWRSLPTETAESRPPAGIGPVRPGRKVSDAEALAIQARAYKEAWDHVINGVEGIPDPVIRAMRDNYAIGTSRQTLNSGWRPAPTVQQQMIRFGMKKDSMQHWTDKNQVMGNLAAFYRRVEFWGNVVELSPKVAGWIAETEHFGLDPVTAGIRVRNYKGTPNVFTKGVGTEMIRNFIPFFNVFMQGWTKDAQLIAGKPWPPRPQAPSLPPADDAIDVETTVAPDPMPKLKSGWWWRFMKTDGLWAILSAAAGANFFGTVLKDLFDGVSSHKKTNANILPWGFTDGGSTKSGKRVMFFEVPRDETSRLLAGLTYHAAKGIFEGNPDQGFSDAFDFGQTDVPGLSPLVRIPWIIPRQDPIDPWRGRHILSEDERRAGAWSMPSVSRRAKWVWNELGGASYYKFNVYANSTTEMLFEATPNVINGLGGITDYGYVERGRQQKAPDQERDAKIKLGFNRTVQQVSAEFNALKAAGRDGRSPTQEDRYQDLLSWHGSYRRDFEYLRFLRDAGYKGEFRRVEKELEAFTENYSK